MNIAVLAWGSLIWSPRSLKLQGDWCYPGPSLPLEFSRISKDGRMTLVIDPVHGIEQPTYFAKSSFGDLDIAIENLCEREGTIRKFIGCQSTERSIGSNAFSTWLSVNGFDAAIWTALPPNFEEKTGQAFSVTRALEYLSDLDGVSQSNALHYFRSAPPKITTAFRHAVEQMYPAN